MATSVPHTTMIQPASLPPGPTVTNDEPSTSTTGDESWRADATCAELGPDAADLFFSEELAEIAAAKRICAECPVLAPCLEGAIARAEPCGVWGGQLFENGRVLMQKRRRGRPPKVARPNEELPVVAVPVHLADRLRLAG